MKRIRFYILIMDILLATHFDLSKKENKQIHIHTQPHTPNPFIIFAIRYNNNKNVRIQHFAVKQQSVIFADVFAHNQH